MDSHDILTLYEDVACLTSRMLDAARVGDWEQLGLLERTCAASISTLRIHDRIEALPPADRERKVAVIRKILDDDKAIREITEPWMKQLSSRILSMSTERKINRAYGASPGS